MSCVRPLLALLALLLVAAPSAAAERIVMVFGPGYPPFYCMGDVDRPQALPMTGAFIDFLTAFERAHPEFIIEKRRLPRVRMDDALRNGEAQAFSLNSPLFVAEKDKELLRFSEPIWRTGDHLYVLQDSALESADIEGLHGKRIGVLHGNGYGPLDRPFARGEIIPNPVYRHELLLDMLAARRIDAYVGNRHTEPHLWGAAGQDTSRYRQLDPPLYEFDLCVVVRKENQDFLEALNRFITSARHNGFLDRLNSRYFPNPEFRETDEGSPASY